MLTSVGVLWRSIDSTSIWIPGSSPSRGATNFCTADTEKIYAKKEETDRCEKGKKEIYWSQLKDYMDNKYWYKNGQDNDSKAKAIYSFFKAFYIRWFGILFWQWNPTNTWWTVVLLYPLYMLSQWINFTRVQVPAGTPLLFLLDQNHVMDAR